MTKRSFRLLACGVATLAFVGVGTGVAAPAALAQGKESAALSQVAKKKKHINLRRALRVNIRTLVLKTSAAYIGISVKELRRELPGHSLAQVARTNEMSVTGLKAALVSAFAAKVNTARTKGRITGRQATRLLARFQKHVKRLVNRKVPAK
jgi:hypothetical protein